MPFEARDIISPGVGVKGSCELLNIGAGDQTQECMQQCALPTAVQSLLPPDSLMFLFCLVLFYFLLLEHGIMLLRLAPNSLHLRWSLSSWSQGHIHHHTLQTVLTGHLYPGLSSRQLFQACFIDIA